MQCIQKLCYSRKTIYKYIESSKILSGTNNLDILVFTCMYSYARVKDRFAAIDYQSAISTPVAVGIKDILSNLKIEQVRYNCLKIF